MAKTGKSRRTVYDDPKYRARRKALMATIGPHTRCGRCGKLLHEHPRHSNGKLGRWEIGHVIDGSNLGPLQIEHSVCNRRAGGETGNARMRQNAAARDGGSEPPRAFTKFRERTEERFLVAGHDPRRYAVGSGIYDNHMSGHYNLAETEPSAPGAAPCMRATGRLCKVCEQWRDTERRERAARRNSTNGGPR